MDLGYQEVHDPRVLEALGTVPSVKILPGNDGRILRDHADDGWSLSDILRQIEAETNVGDEVCYGGGHIGG